MLVSHPPYIILSHTPTGYFVPRTSCHPAIHRESPPLGALLYQGGPDACINKWAAMIQKANKHNPYTHSIPNRPSYDYSNINPLPGNIVIISAHCCVQEAFIVPEIWVCVWQGKDSCQSHYFIFSHVSFISFGRAYEV